MSKRPARITLASAAERGPAIIASTPAVVEVNGWPIANLSRPDTAVAMAELALDDHAAVCACLHVAALTFREERARELGSRADLLGADGWSVVWLARLAGGPATGRSTTTDLAHDIMGILEQRLDRPLRLALVGGEPGLADRAAPVLEQMHRAEVVYTTHGFHGDAEWERIVDELRAAEPDIVLVGMGFPKELQWAVDRRDVLPPGLTLICGGFFGYLAGEEIRAPLLWQRIGLEWLWRVFQQPRRLLPRYIRGLWDALRVTGIVLARRVRGGGPA